MRYQVDTLIENFFCFGSGFICFFFSICRIFADFFFLFNRRNFYIYILYILFCNLKQTFFFLTNKQKLVDTNL